MSEQHQPYEELTRAILSSTSNLELVNLVHQLSLLIQSALSKDVQPFQSRFEGLIDVEILHYLAKQLNESHEDNLRFEIAGFFTLLTIDESPTLFATVPEKMYSVLVGSLSSSLDDSRTEKTLDLILETIQQNQANPHYLEKIQRFHAADIISVILRRVKDFPPSLKAKACRLIGELYIPYETHNFLPPSFSGTLPFVLECFYCDSDDVVIAAGADALKSFTSDLEPESEWVLEIDSNLSLRLIQLLQSSDETIALSALMTVTNITACGSLLTEQLIDERLIPILAELLHSSNKKIVSETCLSIASLTAESEESCQALVDASLFPYLLPLLSTTEDVQVQYKAICAVFGLLSEGSDSHKEYLIEIGGVRAIFDAWQTIDIHTNDLSLIRPLYASLAHLVEFAGSGEEERRTRVTAVLRSEQRDIVTVLDALRLRGVFDREDKEILITIFRFFQAT
eukprot:gene3218-3430_t